MLTAEKISTQSGALTEGFMALVKHKGFPCTGAKTALSRGELETFEAASLLCPADDHLILKALEDFVWRCTKEHSTYRSFALLFRGPDDLTEEQFEQALWRRLQALHSIDSQKHAWDPAVSKDPSDANFSFSLLGHAFYIVGMHPKSSRRARATPFPVLVFNLHSQFEELRQGGEYAKLQSIVRRRDKVFSGSVNPMLKDFRAASEARQYSGRLLDENWVCPFQPN